MREKTQKMQQLLVKKFFENLIASAVKKYLNFHIILVPPPPILNLGILPVGRGRGGGGGVKEHRGGDNGRLLLI